MSTCFLKKGNCFHVSSREAMNLHDLLPPHNFVVKLDMMTGFYLEQIEDFTIPKKVYGNYGYDTDRILNTFKERNKTTGVLLAGEKGSGKTLFSKIVSVKAAKLGIPTITITTDFTGAAFDTFLQMIEQPCIVFIDEFEKVYDKDKQQEILTLLDGVFNSTKLFLFTVNDGWRVDIHMRNRPGRIFYFLNFSGIDRDFITAYCHDNLKDKTQIDTVGTVGMMFEQFNFDMLQGLVEEMNRYNESAHDALRMLNIKPEGQGSMDHEIQLFINGVLVPTKDIDEGGKWKGNPLSSGMNIEWTEHSVKQDNGESEDEYRYARFALDDLKHLSHSKGEFVFENREGDKIVLTRKAPEAFDYRKYLV